MENDLISRSELANFAYHATDNMDVERCVVDWEDIEDAPAVDAVVVVRCKECKWLYRDRNMYCCSKHTGLALIKPDGSSFCSYGERRDKNVGRKWKPASSRRKNRWSTL